MVDGEGKKESIPWEYQRGQIFCLLEDLSPLSETRSGNLDALRRSPHITRPAFPAGPPL